MTSYLKDEELAAVDAWWRAANYLTVGQIYLMANPMLREPLQAEHIKPRLLGHWGTSPGLNLLWAHLNRAICARDVNMMFVTGPGHGGPAIVANTWLEGTYSEVYPEVSRDEAGMERLFRQFSFPGGIPSHVSPEVPGSIHEGGELGYSLMHAYGAVLDNPDLIVACVVGDGEAETGPLAASWFSHVFLNPDTDGVVLPILHLNGFKIANPTVLSRIPDEDLMLLFKGFGYQPIEVAGDDPEHVHNDLAEAIDMALDQIAQSKTRRPMIVLRTPKGWTGPGEGTVKSHQVPLTDPRSDPSALEQWLRSYRADFTDLRLVPLGDKRMSANPHANGGALLRDLVLPPIDPHSVASGTLAEATRQAGSWLREVAVSNPDRFRLFGPDEVASNRLGAVLEVPGRTIEVLSEHLCQGYLEGYLLTGRHGLLTSYEAFIHVVDSMVNQHAKWLKVTRGIGWRRPIASLNYLLTSHVWRQDHNGFSHQDPGFIDHVVNKKAEIVRVYLPPDANTLLSTLEHCLDSRHYINVIVAGKQPAPNWLSLEEARLHCRRGLGIWQWASSDHDGEPDVVLASAGDVPTLEILAAVDLLRQHLPELKVRVVNVVDLMRLQPPSEHPHGMPDNEFDAVFTTDKPIIFAYHGYPWLIHRLAYRRTGHANLHVRGYKEEGTTTTPFDMVMLNDLDRFHLVTDVIDRVPGLAVKAAELRQRMVDERQRCRDYTRAHGEDAPEIRDWQWKH